MDKLTYSSFTSQQVPTGNLSIARRNLVSMESTTAGYFSSGQSVSFPTLYSTTDKITFSTDNTAASPTAALHAAKYNGTATGNSTAGYIMGGNGTGLSTLVDKILYSTDTRSQLAATSLSPYRSVSASTSAKAPYLPSTSISSTSPYTV